MINIDNNKTYKRSLEFREKMSAIRKAFYANGGKHPFCGRKLSEEHNRKFHAKCNTPEAREKRKKSLKLYFENGGIGSRKGVVVSEETKEKMRQAWKRRKASGNDGIKRGAGHWKWKGGLKKIPYQRIKNGFPREVFNSILLKQNYKCAICGNPVSEKKGEGLSVACADHCHKTNTPRGILCTNCNLILGHAFDNIEILERSIKYLRFYQDQFLTEE